MLKLIPFIIYATLVFQISVPGQTATSSSPVVKQTQPTNAIDVLTHARELYTTQGPKTALPEFEKALALFRENSDKKSEAITLGLIGNCYKKFGDFPKAEDYLQRALSMKRAIGDRAEEGKTLSHIGLLHWEMGDYKKATEYLSAAISIGRELKDQILEGSARNNLGLVYDETGDYRRALEQYDQALQLYRGTNFERGIADTLGNIGGVPLLLGEYGKALGYYQQALALDYSNAECRYRLAECLFAMDRKQEAVHEARICLRFDPNMGGGGTLRLMWETTQFSVPFTTQR